MTTLMQLLGYLSPIDLLLLFLSVLIVLCLAGLAISHIMASELDDADEPTYRTADGDTIARQIASLRRTRP